MTHAITQIFAAANGIPDNILTIILAGMVLGLCGMGIAFTAIITDARLKRSRHETIRAALEKGMPVPPELLETPGESNRPREDRRAAIILLALSPGLFLFLWMLGLGAVAYVSVITACIGVALLLNSILDRKQEQNTRGPERDARS